MNFIHSYFLPLLHFTKPVIILTALLPVAIPYHRSPCFTISPCYLPLASSMGSNASLKSFNCRSGTISPILSASKRCSLASWSTTYRSHSVGMALGKLNSSSSGRIGLTVSCVDTPKMTVSSRTDASQNGIPKVSQEKRTLRSATFPDAFETLLTEVCDETSVAELKVKVGNYEMHIKRNIGAANAPVQISSPTVAPPIPSEPMDQSPAAQSSPAPPKQESEKPNPFVKAVAKSPKLSALEASGTSGYKLVSSPAVGSFYRGKTRKGKRFPPECKEGDVIKEGQVIGYVDQFGTQLPVKSDVDGEVLKLLFDDGEAIGYGDPLVAVLPSFHDIK